VTFAMAVWLPAPIAEATAPISALLPTGLMRVSSIVPPLSAWTMRPVAVLLTVAETRPDPVL